MKKLLCLLVLLQSALSYGQNYWCTAYDTIPPNYYLGGKLDSVDLYFSFHSNTFPGLSQNRVEGAILPNQLIRDLGGIRYNSSKAKKHLIHSSLPHLGFGYMFGTQGTQWLTANYQQVLNKKHTLNLDYNAGRSNGFLRNSFSSFHDLNLYYTYNSKRYAFDLKANYTQNDISYNGGITTDSLLNDFGLIFSPVFKENANSKMRGTSVSSTHYFSIVNKDTVQRLGIFLNPEISIFNRKYTESSDTLSLIYSSINIDSINTADQYQMNEVKGGGGVFLNSSLVKLRAGMVVRQWELVNLGKRNAVNEINVLGDVILKYKRLKALANFNSNIIGAQQEWENSVNVDYGLSNFDLNAQFESGAKLPLPYQRYYFGNNLNYSLNNLEKQSYLRGQFSLNYSGITNFEIGVFGGMSSLSGVYSFNGVDWNQNELFDGSYSTLGLQLHYRLKILNIDLKGSYNSGNIVTKSLVQSRVFLQGRMFDRKLNTQIGAEIAYRDRQATYLFHPLIDAYTFVPDQLTIDRFNLHAFLALELKQFRFFVRAENIGYTWNRSEYQDGIGYPIPAMQIRVGFSWDFLN